VTKDVAAETTPIAQVLETDNATKTTSTGLAPTREAPFNTICIMIGAQRLRVYRYSIVAVAAKTNELKI
jgi:hypothetical protein